MTDAERDIIVEAARMARLHADLMREIRIVAMPITRDRPCRRVVERRGPTIVMTAVEPVPCVLRMDGRGEG